MFPLRHTTPRHQCQLSIIRFVPKYLDQTLIIFSLSPAGNLQTGCLWWEIALTRSHVGLKSNFALKNNSMEFVPGHITRINVLYESRLKWTWHHSKLAVEEVSFVRRVKSGNPSTIHQYTMEQSVWRNWASCSCYMNKSAKPAPS